MNIPTPKDRPIARTVPFIRKDYIFAPAQRYHLNTTAMNNDMLRQWSNILHFVGVHGDR